MNIVQEIKQYQEKWLKHVQRMDTNRLPKQALKYKPNGRRNRTTEEEMEGPTSSGGSRNRLTCLTLQEHDDDELFFFFENRVLYEIMWKNLVQTDRSQMTIWLTGLAY